MDGYVQPSGSKAVNICIRLHPPVSALEDLSKWLGTLLGVLPVVSQLGKSRWEELAGSNTAGKHAAHAVLHSQSKGAPTLVFELSSRASFLVILSY